MRKKIYEIIFKSDTPMGKGFDIVLIISILLSVFVVFIDSVQYYNNLYSKELYILEWFFTIIFTIEYFLRIYCIRKPLMYVKSFFGIIDLLSIIPTYISVFFPVSRYLSVIRILRVLRIFRILKLINYISESNQLMKALIVSRRKIIVFLFFILSMVTIFGSIMYLIEGEQNGFTSIPRSIYWAIVAITTLGYGDVAPKTELGQALASLVMILGYATIAVPTGIISAEYSNMSKNISNEVCPSCSSEQHDYDADFCNKCGTNLNS